MTEKTLDPVRRPGLAYQHAFDWLAVQLQAVAGPVAARLPTSFHGVELLRRLPALPMLPPLPAGLKAAASALGLSPVEVGDALAAGLQAVAWTEPPIIATGELDSLAASLRAGGRLYLIAPGPPGRFLAERREERLPSSMSARAVVSALANAGWSVRERLGLHGPRAIAWYYAGQAAGTVRGAHWQDRFHFAMRRDFVETGLASRLSAITLIEAEKPA